ncbi:hypothetical protein F4679DRAFT_263942 [Xylaria curta]|nr:hypothetical protein F4679DRAFT_263942 [Xylaria curta]
MHLVLIGMLLVIWAMGLSCAPQKKSILERLDMLALQHNGSRCSGICLSELAASERRPASAATTIKRSAQCQVSQFRIGEPTNPKRT